MIYIKKQWCKGCGLCCEVCAKNVLEVKNLIATVVNEKQCVSCRQCENVCPDFAIHIRRDGNE